MVIKRQNKTKEEIVEAVRDYLDYFITTIESN